MTMRAVRVAGFSNAATTFVTIIVGQHPQMLAAGEVIDLPDERGHETLLGLDTSDTAIRVFANATLPWLKQLLRGNDNARTTASIMARSNAGFQATPAIIGSVPYPPAGLEVGATSAAGSPAMLDDRAAPMRNPTSGCGVAALRTTGQDLSRGAV